MFFFFKQKTAYEMRISDWSSDVCSSDLTLGEPLHVMPFGNGRLGEAAIGHQQCAGRVIGEADAQKLARIAGHEPRIRDQAVKFRLESAKRKLVRDKEVPRFERSAREIGRESCWESCGQ